MGAEEEEEGRSRSEGEKEPCAALCGLAESESEPEAWSKKDGSWAPRDWTDVAARLLRDEFAVVEAASPRLSAQLLDELRALEEAMLLETSLNALAVARNGDSVTRRAVLPKPGVLELNFHLDGKPCVDGPAQVAARQLCPKLRDFAGTAGAALARLLGEALKVDLFVDEVKAQSQSSKACFPAHFDTTDASVRVLTAILYLNEGYTEGDGGELALLPLCSADRDVQPAFSTLALFSSTSVLHCTRPTNKRRRCVSFWFGAKAKAPILRRRRPMLLSPPRPPLCASAALLAACDLGTRRALAKLTHEAEYAASFRRAFGPSADVDAALTLDAENNRHARATLDPGLLAEAHRRFPCHCSAACVLADTSSCFFFFLPRTR